MQSIQRVIRAALISAMVGVLFASVPAAHAAGATFTVTTTTNSLGDGACSLEEAVRAANGLSGGADCGFGSPTETDIIAFAIGSGAQTITLSTQQTISQPVYIDGSTQPGYAGTPLIHITRSNGAYMFWLDGPGGDGSTFKGLQLTNTYTGAAYGGALYFDGSSNNHVLGNYINTDGSSSVGDEGKGISINLGGNSNVIGGNAPIDANYFGGQVGIEIVNGANNVIDGNYFGVQRDGSTLLAAMPTEMHEAIYIGYPGATSTGNTISDNVIGGYSSESYGSSAIYLVGTSADQTAITGNRIGVGANGTTDIGNYMAIVDTGASNITVSGNWIANTQTDALYLNSTSSVATATGNCFTNNTRSAVYYQNTVAGPAPFEGNWWGSALGPTHPGNPGGDGDAVMGTGSVDYSPFLAMAPALCVVQRLANPDFELDTNHNKKPDGWSFSGFTGLTDKRDCRVRYSGACSLKLVGNGTTKTATQTINISGATGHDFSYSLWSKAGGVPSGSTYRVQVKFYNGATLLTTKTLNFRRGTHGFQQVSGSLLTPWPYTRVVFKVIFKAASGKAWFDAAQLNWSP